MATTKKRLNITLSKDLEEAISALAKMDNVPEATKAAELLESAIELEEEDRLLALALERDTKDAEWLSKEELLKKLKNN